jgi:hypothetical protein
MALRAACSKTARACSSVTPGNHSTNCDTGAPSSRFSKSAATGTRVPRNTHAPLTRSGSRSTAGQDDQSIMREILPLRGTRLLTLLRCVGWVHSRGLCEAKRRPPRAVGRAGGLRRVAPSFRASPELDRRCSGSLTVAMHPGANADEIDHQTIDPDVVSGPPPSIGVPWSGYCRGRHAERIYPRSAARPRARISRRGMIDARPRRELSD